MRVPKLKNKLLKLIKMKTKNEIKKFIESKIEQITYDIEYFKYKKDDIIVFNLQDKRNVMIDIFKGIGIENDFIIESIKNGQLIFENDKNR